MSLAYTSRVDTRKSVLQYTMENYGTNYQQLYISPEKFTLNLIRRQL